MAVVLLHNQESGQLNPTFRSQPLKIEPVQLVFFFDSPNSHSSTTVTVHNISDSHHPFDFILPRSGCFKLDLPPRVGLQSGDSREFKLTYAAHGMQIEDDLLEIQCETFSYRIPMHCFPVYTNTLFPPVISFSDRKPGETLTRLYRFESAHSIEYPFVIDTKDLDSHVTVTPTSGIIPSSGGVECTITLVCDDTLPASGNLGKFIMKGNAIRQRTTLLECPADHTAARHTSTIPASFIMNRPSHRSITSRASYTQSTSFSKTSRNPSDSSRDHSKSFSFSLSFDSVGDEESDPSTHTPSRKSSRGSRSGHSKDKKRRSHDSSHKYHRRKGKGKNESSSSTVSLSLPLLTHSTDRSTLESESSLHSSELLSQTQSSFVFSDTFSSLSSTRLTMQTGDSSRTSFSTQTHSPSFQNTGDSSSFTQTTSLGSSYFTSQNTPLSSTTPSHELSGSSLNPTSSSLVSSTQPSTTQFHLSSTSSGSSLKQSLTSSSMTSSTSSRYLPSTSLPTSHTTRTSHTSMPSSFTSSTMPEHSITNTTSVQGSPLSSTGSTPLTSLSSLTSSLSQTPSSFRMDTTSSTMTHPTTSLPSSDSGTQSTSFTTTTASPPPTTLSMPLSSSQPSTNESSNSFLSSFSKTASTIQSGLASSLPPTVSSASTTDPPREGQNSVVINPLPTPASGQAQSIQLHPTSPYVLTLPSASSSSNFSSFTSDFSTIFTVPDSNSGANSFNQSRSSAFYTYSTIPNSNPRFVTPGESSLSSFSLSHSFSTSFAASDNLNREPLSLNSIKGRMARAGVSAEEDLSEVVCLFDSNLRLIRRVKGAKQTMLCLSHRCLPCGSLFMASQRNYQKGLSSFGVKQRQEIFRLKEMNDEVANPNGVLLRSTNFGSPSDSIQFGIVSAVHIECFLFLCLVKHVVERVVHTQFWAVAENRNAVLVGVESLDDIWRIIGMLSNRKMNGEFIVIEFAAFER